MNNSKEITNDVNNAEEVFDKPIFVPETDIYEDSDNIFVISNIPGVTENDVEIGLDNKVLTFTATQQERILDGYERVGNGTSTGVFRRSFKIEADIDVNKISAKIKNGVLKITLPKSEDVKPKRIKVKAG